MDIKELLPGDTFYMPTDGWDVKKFTYIGRHPRNYKAFLFYDAFDEVKTIRKEEVEKMLELNIREYWDGYKASLEKVKALAVSMEEFLKEKEVCK